MRVNKIWGTIIIIVSIIMYAFLGTAIICSQDSIIVKVFWILLCCFAIISLLAYVHMPSNSKKPIAEGYVVAIVPVYNEDSIVTRRTIEALLGQSVTIDEIHVVDDGSDKPMKMFNHPRVFCYRQNNAGKRYAQAAALKRLNPKKVDFILTVDSDSILDMRAVEYMLRALSDPKVKACSGSVLASNFNKNTLTKIQEFDYMISFFGRCTKRLIGMLETTSGACAMYRSKILFYHLEDYLKQGKAGDDRRLCIYSLLEGKVLHVQEAIAYTQVPENIKQLYKQRIRWSISGWDSVPVYLANFGIRIWFFPVLNMIQTVITPILFISIIIQSLFFSPTILIYLLIYTTMILYTEAALYVSTRRGWSLVQRFWYWLTITPLLVVITYIINLPARYTALFHLGDTTWGTRSKGSVAPKLND